MAKKDEEQVEKTRVQKKYEIETGIMQKEISEFALKLDKMTKKKAGKN